MNSIHPYSVDTSMVETESMTALFGKWPHYLHSFAPMPYPHADAFGQLANEHAISPDEVADVVAWLAGPGSATLSGSQIAVDRGVMKY